MNMKKALIIFYFTIILGTSFSCGVKGPPLPPVVADPSDSERENVKEVVVTPSPSPSPILRKKSR